MILESYITVHCTVPNPCTQRSHISLTPICTIHFTIHYASIWTSGRQWVDCGEEGYTSATSWCPLHWISFSYGTHSCFISCVLYGKGSGGRPYWLFELSLCTKCVCLPLILLSQRVVVQCKIYNIQPSIVQVWHVHTWHYSDLQAQRLMHFTDWIWGNPPYEWKSSLITNHLPSLRQIAHFTLEIGCFVSNCTTTTENEKLWSTGMQCFTCTTVQGCIKGAA